MSRSRSVRIVREKIKGAKPLLKTERIMSRILLPHTLPLVIHYVYHRLAYAQKLLPTWANLRKIKMVWCQYCSIHLPAHEAPNLGYRFVLKNIWNLMPLQTTLTHDRQ